MHAGPWNKSSGFMLFAAIILRVCTLEVGTPKIAFAENPLMTLSVTNFEVGISYRDVQWHAPIGTITNPCSQADFFLASIDWGDETTA